MGWICQENQDYIQQQDKGSRYQVEDWIFQIEKIEHSRLHDRVQSLSYEDRYRWPAHNIFVEEEYMTRYHQDHIRISTHCGTRDA